MKELDDIYINLEEVKKLSKTTSDYKDFCYLIYDAYQNDPKTISAICKELGISKDEFLNYVRDYKKEEKDSYFLMRNAYDKKMIYMNTGYGKTYDTFLKELLKAKTKEEIISIYQKYDKKYYRSLAIFGYIINMYPDKKEANKIFNEYYKRKYIYKDYLRKMRIKKLEEEKALHLKEKEEIALTLLKRILQDDEPINLSEVIAKYQLSATAFAYIRSVWIEHGLYDQVTKKLKENRSRVFNKRYAGLIEKILPLADKDSITIGNRTRNLDLLDCYSYFQGDFPLVLETCRSFYNVDSNDMLTKKRLGNLKRILGHNGNIYNAQIESDQIAKKLIENVLLEKHEVDFQEVDKDGFIIPGSGHILTEKEQKDIFKAMKENHIPINRSMYELALRRWHDGKLELITSDTIENYINKPKTK